VMVAEGQIQVFFGGASFQSSVAARLTSPTSTIGFGGNASLVGDVNGDGFADLLVSETFPSSPPGSPSDLEGRIYAFFGGTSFQEEVGRVYGDPSLMIGPVLELALLLPEPRPDQLLSRWRTASAPRRPGSGGWVR
jgi:hypothetical protein